ncbi:pyridoxamine 5'-phosphate oxidase family protein [Streptomyces sp. ISL-99]|uniref:pyridoxamine 5'-phosphate oxidase family protein n=1 Tax=Streptomyces sp. ISL-99 TaxID=2819193 RepID=UPI001BEAAD5E|nr:pyridoxamine 5'-phosphate oxidase family protein [Streptomyces sp. ISL-99]MBT2527090.1 pyridoxamine 5'-phosphate oxidase family protein [Streptomyces sp. ISL-99]
MTTTEPARTREQRKQDVLDRLAKDDDLWVATASPDGEPCLVPLSFVWDRDTLLMCTRRTNPTARNLTPAGEARVSLGHTRDVVLIEGAAEPVEGTELATESADAFTAKLGWDPRDRKPWVYLRVTPRTVKAWREENELAERDLMRDGDWLV